MQTGAAAAPDTRPASPRARQRGRVNAATLGGSARGATAGVSVEIRGALCRPQQLREAYWSFSHGVWTRPPMTHAQLPRLSDCRHLRPYEKYWGRGRGQEREGHWRAGPHPMGKAPVGLT